MSIPFPPEREKDVTTLPLAGHRQRFTAALLDFAALELLFFELLAEADFLLVVVLRVDFFGAFEAVPVDAAGARALLLLDVRGAAVVEAVLGGLVRRSFWPGKIV
jgi:hypothetical protein